MFFFGIFGVQNKQLAIKDVQNIICKTCGKMSFYKLIKVYEYFHIFFIPIFKWNVKYYAISRCCSTVFEVPSEIGQDIEKGIDVTITDNDLHQIYTQGGAHICPHCRRELQDDFEFCPYCGNKIS